MKSKNIGLFQIRATIIGIIFFGFAMAPKDSNALVLGFSTGGAGFVIAGGVSILGGGLATGLGPTPPDYITVVMLTMVGAILDEDLARIGGVELKNLEKQLEENQYFIDREHKRRVMADFSTLHAVVNSNELGQKFGCVNVRENLSRLCEAKSLAVDLKHLKGQDSKKRIQFVQDTIEQFYGYRPSGEVVSAILDVSTTLED